MQISLLAGRLTGVAILASVAVLMVAVQGAAAAQVAPQDFNCGDPSLPLVPCNQTAHFSDMFQVGTPLNAPSCPSFVSTDYVTIVGTGNGVEHSIVNNALDGWFTSTWTGTVTLTAYLDANVTRPDTAVPVLTGQLTEWFGGSFNRSNFVFHSTFHLNVASADGSTSLRVLDVSHTNSAPGVLGPPHSFEITRCG
jgi:hypothetical protein